MNIIEEIKSVTKLIQQVDNIELYRSILDIQNQALSLLEENGDLKKENSLLKSRLEIRGKREFERDAYWIKNDDKREGPYCTRCWDVDDKQVRLRVAEYHFGWAVCPHCKKFAGSD